MIPQALVLLLQATPLDADQEAARQAVMASLTGAFLGDERSEKGEGTGHILAHALPGGFLARDYWSVARGRRVYAGTDVLELGANGDARHWWFGSRGDAAEASGRWNERELVLVVRAGDGDPLRRYTYRLDVEPPLVFRFTNEHADGDGWEWFMGSSWRRSEDLRPPPDFRVPPVALDEDFPEALAGSFTGPGGSARGRWLFDEWLVLETPREYLVLAAGWFGRAEGWLWREEGASALRGRMRDGILKLEGSIAPGKPVARCELQVLPDAGGFRIHQPGAPGAPLRAWRQYERPAPQDPGGSGGAGI